MGFFDVFKNLFKEKEIIIPPADEEKVNWFFSEDAKDMFKRTLRYAKEMYEIGTQEGGMSDLIFYTGEGSARREELPCTFFADYLRALNTIAVPRLTFMAADLAIDGEAAPAIPYPNCLKAEYNPLINFAIKIKPLFYSKNGKDIQFDPSMNVLIIYLHNLYANGLEDESNEAWIYERSLWFNEKGIVREWREILEDIKSNVKNKQLLKEVLA